MDNSWSTFSWDYNIKKQSLLANENDYLATITYHTLKVYDYSE